MLQNNAQVKDPGKVQDRPMDFNIIMKCTLIYSDFTLQLTFKKYDFQVSLNYQISTIV